MLILKDNKKYRILLKMQHFIITTLALSLNPTPDNYHQTLWTGHIPVKQKKIGCAKLNLSYCRRTSSMFSCVHKSTSTGISVSNQSMQCRWSAITLYDGRCCVSSHFPQFRIVPALGCSSISHLKAQWNGKFIAATEFQVICLYSQMFHSLGPWSYFRNDVRQQNIYQQEKTLHFKVSWGSFIPQAALRVDVG